MYVTSLSTPSDMIIYDLEDSVPPSAADKASSRARLSAFLGVCIALNALILWVHEHCLPSPTRASGRTRKRYQLIPKGVAASPVFLPILGEETCPRQPSFLVRCLGTDETAIGSWMTLAYGMDALYLGTVPACSLLGPPQ
ncbi:hypothetical protein B0H19DRAFT_396264 [Mycena capillaripes]|nr:hypothetical protein B0H19DRAFT_396264 [Mycena capillaripes]